ncbi:glycosyltransferase [Chryseobacterium sp. cx-311]|uniref:glycosyltransferase n=1 Tax=Marnyiella aurantia TaxID=2758037 RepID=UPI001AE4DEE8|nr:glycosyltransferase [Marnyiella aurantia]MBP0612952.1 glycosyltransferase [Marnyiella aurantia]
MNRILHVFSIIGTAEAFFDGQFRYLYDHGFEVNIICSPSERIAAFAKKNFTQYAEIEISRSIKPLTDLRSILKICKYIRKNRIGTVVGHTPKGALLAMISGTLTRVPNRIYYRHGLIYTTKTGVSRAILKGFEYFISSLSTKIIDVSPSVAKLCIDANLNPENKQQLIGKGSCGGIDTFSQYNPLLINLVEQQALRTRLNIDQDSLVIGFAGRLCRDKGINELVQAFKILQSSYPDKNICLLLVGDHDQRDHLEPDIINEIESNPKIIRTGWISSTAMNFYYSLMDVFVFPSYREGFGMSVIEASSMQIPVLVSQSHGCVDTIFPEVTGRYIKIHPVEIAQDIPFFFDEFKRQEFGRNGRAWVSANFDKTVLWPEMLKIYC